MGCGETCSGGVTKRDGEWKGVGHCSALFGLLHICFSCKIGPFTMYLGICVCVRKFYCVSLAIRLLPTVIRMRVGGTMHDTLRILRKGLGSQRLLHLGSLEVLHWSGETPEPRYADACHLCAGCCLPYREFPEASYFPEYSAVSACSPVCPGAGSRQSCRYALRRYGSLAVRIVGGGCRSLPLCYEEDVPSRCEGISRASHAEP